jgi:hypothetical protein
VKPAADEDQNPLPAKTSPNQLKLAQTSSNQLKPAKTSYIVKPAKTS